MRARVWTPSAGLLALPIGFLLAGTLGAVIAGLMTWLVLLLVVGSRVPSGRVRRARRRQPTPLADAGFPTYRRFLSLLGWAQRSPRHFDYAVRPTLQLLTAARLAERRGLDMYGDRPAAAELLGDDWELVDPARPARALSAPPGVALARLERLVRRLEEL